MIQVMRKPVTESVVAGLVASLCCGGSLVFASIGLGAFYGSLGLWRHIAPVLAAGSFSIIGINHFFYQRVAERTVVHGAALLNGLRRSMLVSAFLGVIAMVGTFVFLEWLNHGVVNPRHFLTRPEYAQTLIVGVPNLHLIYALASFLSLATLWALPFPRSQGDGTETVLRLSLRLGVIFATVGVILILFVATLRQIGMSGEADGNHGRDSTPQHQPSP